VVLFAALVLGWRVSSLTCVLSSMYRDAVVEEPSELEGEERTLLTLLTFSAGADRRNARAG